MEQTKQQDPSKGKIVDAVCTEYGIKQFSSLYTKCRARNIVEPRMIIIVLCRFGLGMTWADAVGDFGFGTAAAKHAHSNVRDFYNQYKDYRERLNTIVANIYPAENNQKLLLSRIMSEANNQGGTVTRTIKPTPILN